MACKKSKYKCEYANVVGRGDDEVEVVEGPSKGKKKATGPSRPRERKPKATGSTRGRGRDDDDDDKMEVEDVPAPIVKSRKRTAGGTVRVKTEKTAPPQVSKKTSDVKVQGAAVEGSGGEDEDAEGDDDLDVEQPKVKRARVRVGPPREESKSFIQFSYVRYTDTINL